MHVHLWIFTTITAHYCSYITLWHLCIHGTPYSEYYYDGAISLSGKDDTSYYLAITNSMHQR